MAFTTIDPLMKIKPSEKLKAVVLELYEEEKSNTKDIKRTLPSGITSLIKDLKDSTSDVTFHIEDIQWIYERKKSLNSSALNHSNSSVSDIKR